MSHSEGLCRFPDGSVLWFEYNGTSEICQLTLFVSRAELHLHWREPGLQPTCSCGAVSEPVDLYNRYGNGACWKGKACRRCMCITDGMMEYDGYGNIIVKYGDEEWALPYFREIAP